MKHCLPALLLPLICIAAPLRAQAGPGADPPLDAATRRAVLSGVLARLDSDYVFPEVARSMEREIRARERRGEYRSIRGSRELADSLTAHLRAVSRDDHLSVVYREEPIELARPQDAPSAELRARWLAHAQARNHGVRRVEVLSGNVGYLELSGFFRASDPGAAETVAAAMSLLRYTDALIVDLRGNRGGDPEMVALVASYLFGADSVHLNDLYSRPDDRTRQFWTHASLAGPRYGPERPVFVLTSGETFSAGEEFAYDLQTQRRATLVGENTGGGAHPGGLERVTAHFGVWVPSGRAINPITGTDWEGGGVRPDVRVPAADALQRAHRLALRAALERATDPERRREIEAALAGL